MGKEKDLYEKLLYRRPKKMYQTYNTINRSNNILYVLKEIRYIPTNFGYYLIHNETFVTCTKYVDGQYKVTVKIGNKNTHEETITITGKRAHAVYDHAKKYCK